MQSRSYSRLYMRRNEAGNAESELIRSVCEKVRGGIRRVGVNQECMREGKRQEKQSQSTQRESAKR